MRNTLGQIRSYLASSYRGTPAVGDLSRPDRILLYLVRLGVRIVRQWLRDKCPQQAMALAFQTALSLVPIFAIAFSLLRTSGSLDEQSRLQSFFADRLFPNMPDVAAMLETFSKKISVGALGGLGLFFTLATCYSLYSFVERIFNDIWRVRERRSLIGKFLTFYAMLTLLPALAGFSLYQSGKLLTGTTTARFLAPLAIQLGALLFMNKLLPRTNVRWLPALVGALVSSTCIEAVKFAFVSYAQKVMLDKYAGIYGSLGLVPIFLLWTYVSWLLVLLGAEIAHAAQNLKVLEAEDRRRNDDEPINALVAAQLLAAVAAGHRHGRGIPKEQLATSFGLTTVVVERIFERLKKAGLAAEVRGDLEGYIVARPTAEITMEDVLGAFRATDLETAEGTTSEALRKLVGELEDDRRRRIAGVTVADLVPRGEPPAV